MGNGTRSVEEVGGRDLGGGCCGEVAKFTDKVAEGVEGVGGGDGNQVGS